MSSVALNLPRDKKHSAPSASLESAVQPVSASWDLDSLPRLPRSHSGRRKRTSCHLLAQVPQTLDLAGKAFDLSHKLATSLFQTCRPSFLARRHEALCCPYSPFQISSPELRKSTKSTLISHLNR